MTSPASRVYQAHVGIACPKCGSMIRLYVDFVSRVMTPYPVVCQACRAVLDHMNLQVTVNTVHSIHLSGDGHVVDNDATKETETPR